MAGHFDMAKPSVSHHFAKLKQADLIVARRDGQQIFYSLNTTVAEDLVAATAAQGVDGLVRGDGVQPRPDRPTRRVHAELGVKLQEGILKNVVGQAAVAEIPRQVTVQLALIAPHQHPERLALSPAETGDQIFVGECGQIGHKSLCG